MCIASNITKVQLVRANCLVFTVFSCSDGEAPGRPALETSTIDTEADGSPESVGWDLTFNRYRPKHTPGMRGCPSGRASSSNSARSGAGPATPS